MNDVFISYSRRDKVFTQKLFEALKAVNRDVWADWDDIPASSDWFAEIKQGIEETDSVIFVLSPEWIKSRECRKEMDYAVQMGKRLFPILYIPVDPKDAPPELAKINWVYMRDTDDFEKGFQTLCSAMDTDLDWIKTHTRIQIRALEWEKKKRSASFALRGEDLTEGEQFIANGAEKNPIPTHLQSEYILASRKDATKRQRQTLAGVTVALIVSIVLGVVAVIQRQEAKRQSIISRAGELAAQSLSLIDRNYQNSLLLAIESYRKYPNVQTMGALLDITNAKPKLRNIITNQDDVSDIDLSPDGKTLALSYYGDTVILFNTFTGKITGQLRSEGIDIFSSVTYSYDGKMVAAGGCGEDTCAIILWDTKTQEAVRLEPPEAGGMIIDIIFSPDDKKLLSLDGYPLGPQNVMLWNITTKPITRKLITPQGSIPKSIAFSPNGEFIAIGNSQNIGSSVNLLDAEDLQPIDPQIPYGLQEITNISFSRDGKTIALTHLQNYSTLWNLAGESENIPVNSYSDAVTVVFSPDGKLIASGNADGAINLWNTIPSYQFFGQPLTGQANEASRIYFSRDGNILASLSGKSIYIWDLNASQLQSAHTLTEQKADNVHFISGGDMMILESNGGTTGSTTYTTDGETILTFGFSNGTITSWDVSGRTQIGKSISGNILAFSPDDKNYVSSKCTNVDKSFGCDQFETVLRDASTGNRVGFPFVSIDTITAAVFSLDRKNLAFQVSDRIILWNPYTDKQLRLPGKEIIGFSSNGKALVMVSDANEITLRDVESGNQIGEPITATLTELSPDGKTLASTNNDGIITLWDIATGKRIFEPFTTSTNFLAGMAFSPNSRILAFHDGHSLGMLDTTTLKLTKKWDAPYPDSIAFSLDGNILITSSSTLSPIHVNLWNLKTNERITVTEFLVAFGPDSKMFATRDYQKGTITLWDIATGQTIGQPIKNFGTNLAFSPNGNLLVASKESEVFLMDLDPEKWIVQSCQRVGRNFTRDEWAKYFSNDEYSKTCEQWDLEPISAPTVTQ